MLTINENLVDLISNQRTNLKGKSLEFIQEKYNKECHKEADLTEGLLPDDPTFHLLDIGVGLAGIDVQLQNRRPHANIYLLDFNGK